MAPYHIPNVSKGLIRQTEIKGGVSPTESSQDKPNP